jgi:glycosyltransferase involved in cell wall biosynthesis
VKKSKLILTSTEFNKKEILNFYDSFLKDKIQVIPLAYDNNKFNSNIKKQENIYGRYILSIGRLEEKKNTKRIVEAFNILKKDLPDLKLILIGAAGAGYDEVKQAIDTSEYKTDIILLGFVLPQDLTSILAQAQVFVFPSLYEGFGIPILEAMAVGVPVIASKGTALPEVGGEAAVYADPLVVKDFASKIVLLIKDENLRKQQINLGWQRVKDFSWQKTAGQTWQILKNIK